LPDAAPSAPEFDLLLRPPLTLRYEASPPRRKVGIAFRIFKCYAEVASGVYSQKALSHFTLVAIALKGHQQIGRFPCNQAMAQVCRKEFENAIELMRVWMKNYQCECTEGLVPYDDHEVPSDRNYAEFMMLASQCRRERLFETPLPLHRLGLALLSSIRYVVSLQLACCECLRRACSRLRTG
jgi:hypothetical protein